MAFKKIIWSDLAKAQFRDTLEFYRERNQSVTYSLKLIDETEDLLKTVSKSEFIGRLTDLRMVLWRRKKTLVIQVNY